jgi:dinuclear metal center YbgI/SA1388 family protein
MTTATAAAINLTECVAWLDRELRIAEIPDFPGAHNGLQLEAAGPVRRIAAAVDASLPAVEAAAAAGAGLLLVHHGLFWQGVQPVTGAWFRKLKTALDAGLAIYSAHLPLDVHPTLGNNHLLAAALGLTTTDPVLPWNGIHLGLAATTDEDRSSFTGRVAAAVGGPVHLCPGGPERVRRVAIVTGAGGPEAAAAARAGCDTRLTGAGPHWSFPHGLEAQINILYAGHYATETFGVRALAAALARHAGIEWTFLDHPTGL